MEAKKEQKHIKVFICLFIVIIFAYRIFLIWSYSFGVPVTDFFDYRRLAILMERGEILWGYRRLPLFPLFIVVFAQPFKLLRVGDPYLLSAYCINLSTMSGSIPLLYLINKRILKKKAFALLSTFLFFINPEYLQWNIQPILETFFVFCILLTFYFYFFREVELKYVGVCFSSLIRYEAVLLAPIFMLDDIFFKKEAKKPLILGFLAMIPLVFWIASSYVIYGIPGYLEIMQSNDSFSGTRFLQTLIGTVTIGIYFYGSFIRLDARSLVVGLGVILALILGIVNYRKNRFFIPLFLWLSGYTGLHMFYFPFYRFVVPILWLVITFCIFGIYAFFSLVKKQIHYNFSMTQQLFLMTLIIVFLSFYQFFQKDYALRTLMVDFVIVLSLIGVLSAVIVLEVGKRKNISKILFVLIILLIMSAGAVFNGDVRTYNRAYEKIQFKKVGEWYNQVATERDVIVATDAHLIQYYAGLPEQHFIGTGQLHSNNTGEFIIELSVLNATYVVWDSHHGRRLKDSNYYIYKVYLITFLEDGVDKPHFKLVYSVNIRNKIAYVYKFVP